VIGVLALLHVLCKGAAAPVVDEGSRRQWEKVAAGMCCGGGKHASLEHIVKGRDNHPIRMLDLSNNEIREAGGQAVAAIICLGET
jgi:hypothetical protein